MQIQSKPRKKYTIMTPELKARIVQLYNEGKTYVEMKAILEEAYLRVVSSGTISRYVRLAGCPPRSGRRKKYRRKHKEPTQKLSLAPVVCVLEKAILHYIQQDCYDKSRKLSVALSLIKEV